MTPLGMTLEVNLLATRLIKKVLSKKKKKKEKQNQNKNSHR